MAYPYADPSVTTPISTTDPYGSPAMTTNPPAYVNPPTYAPGWEPRANRPAPARDGRAMTVLRVITYVSATLASVAFLAVVIFGGVTLYRLASAFGSAGSPFSTSDVTPYVPTPEELNAGDPSGHTAFCFANPTDPACAGGN